MDAGLTRESPVATRSVMQSIPPASQKKRDKNNHVSFPDMPTHAGPHRHTIPIFHSTLRSCCTDAGKPHDLFVRSMLIVVLAAVMSLSEIPMSLSTFISLSLRDKKDQNTTMSFPLLCRAYCRALSLFRTLFLTLRSKIQSTHPGSEDKA